MNINTLIAPLSKNMHLVIIGLYAYFLLFHVGDNEYVTMIALTAATCMAICYLKKKEFEGLNNSSCSRPIEEGFQSCSRPIEEEGFKNNKTTKKTTQKRVKKVGKEGFDNPPPPSPGSNVVRQLPDNMGAYDGLCLQTGNRESWMKTPDETALVPNNALFTYLSSQGPLKPVFTDNSALTGPPVDGHPDSDKKMFMFANNRTSPNCCPSTYTTSTGCVCTTKNQRDFVASRGGATGTADLQDL